MTGNQSLDIGAAILAAVAVAGVCRNRGWSTAIPLLVAGLVVGIAPFGPTGPADPEFVLVLVLAPLVFGEALTSSIVDLRRVSRPIMALAVGLVVFGGVVVGVIDGERVRCARVLANGAPFDGKAEGVVFDPSDPRRGFLVIDRDAPDAPAELLRLELSGPW